MESILSKYLLDEKILEFRRNKSKNFKVDICKMSRARPYEICTKIYLYPDL